VDLNKKCKYCNIDLTTENATKKNQKYYKNFCRKCNSKQVQKFNTGNEKRKKYMREYTRRKGIVKEYPCETCGALCYKKYAKAFCSDKCRFLSYVDCANNIKECWIWNGALNKKGYGKVCFKENKTAIASRVSYEIFKGPIEVGLYICHMCDNPRCVNPDHLWVGTHVENMTDMRKKGRQSSKLKSCDVCEIRKLWEDGYSQCKIMEKFHIASPSVSNIISRRNWKYV